MFLRQTKWGIALLAAAIPFAVFTHVRGQQVPGAPTLVQDDTDTYSSGLSVIPSYDGFHVNPDKTIDMWFSYHNENWQEELDVPIGPNNSFEPLGPDLGQPTHFQPRTNRWTFTVRIPGDWKMGDSNELTWTVTSHGKTYQAHGVLKPDYFQDDNGMQREAGVETPPLTNKPPVVTIVGETHRTAKVGQPIVLSAVCTDDGLPKYPEKDEEGKPRAPDDWHKPPYQRAAYGLRMSWVVYRSPGRITLDPPQFESWEDQRGGSASARTWAPPPVPPDHLWAVRATFSEAGEYMLQARGSDGLFFTNQYVTVTVTP